jgi:hypothetical protein
MGKCLYCTAGIWCGIPFRTPLPPGEEQGVREQISPALGVEGEMR